MQAKKWLKRQRRRNHGTQFILLKTIRVASQAQLSIIESSKSYRTLCTINLTSWIQWTSQTTIQYHPFLCPYPRNQTHWTQLGYRTTVAHKVSTTSRCTRACKFNSKPSMRTASVLASQRHVAKVRSAVKRRWWTSQTSKIWAITFPMGVKEKCRPLYQEGVLVAQLVGTCLNWQRLQVEHPTTTTIITQCWIHTQTQLIKLTWWITLHWSHHLLIWVKTSSTAVLTRCRLRTCLTRCISWATLESKTRMGACWVHSLPMVGSHLLQRILAMVDMEAKEEVWLLSELRIMMQMPIVS